MVTVASQTIPSVSATISILCSFLKESFTVLKVSISIDIHELNFGKRITEKLPQFINYELTERSVWMNGSLSRIMSWNLISYVVEWIIQSRWCSLADRILSKELDNCFWIRIIDQASAPRWSSNTA